MDKITFLFQKEEMTFYTMMSVIQELQQINIMRKWIKLAILILPKFSFFDS